MADYRLQEGGVLRVADNASIPANPNNRDWQAYQAWLGGGNTPDPAVRQTLGDAKAAAIDLIGQRADKKIRRLWLAGQARDTAVATVEIEARAARAQIESALTVATVKAAVEAFLGG